MGQNSSTSVENQLSRLENIADDMSLSASERKKRIRDLIKSWQDYFKKSPTSYIYPQGGDYIIIHGILKNGDHVIYIHQGDKGQAMIIPSLKNHEEMTTKGQEFLEHSMNKSKELHNNLNHANDRLEDERAQEAVSKVQKLLVDMQDKLPSSVAAMGGPYTIAATDLLNRVNQYLNFGNEVLTNSQMTMPINGDVIHELTGNILGSLNK